MFFPFVLEGAAFGFVAFEAFDFACVFALLFARSPLFVLDFGGLAPLPVLPLAPLGGVLAFLGFLFWRPCSASAGSCARPDSASKDHFDDLFKMPRFRFEGESALTFRALPPFLPFFPFFPFLPFLLLALLAATFLRRVSFASALSDNWSFRVTKGMSGLST